MWNYKVRFGCLVNSKIPTVFHHRDRTILKLEYLAVAYMVAPLWVNRDYLSRASQRREARLKKL